MMSRTRAVVKLRRHAIENVRRIHTPPDKQRCNLWSIVAVPLFLHPLTTTECSITWTVSNWDPWAPHIALHASWNVPRCLKHLETVQAIEHSVVVNGCKNSGTATIDHKLQHCLSGGVWIRCTFSMARRRSFTTALVRDVIMQVSHCIFSIVSPCLKYWSADVP